MQSAIQSSPMYQLAQKLMPGMMQQFEQGNYLGAAVTGVKEFFGLLFRFLGGLFKGGIRGALSGIGLGGGTGSALSQTQLADEGLGA